MPTFKDIIDVALVAAMLFFIWALVTAARSIARHEVFTVNRIVFTLRKLELLIERTSYQLERIEAMADNQERESCRGIENK